ncbi:MAG TPA: YhdP family protein [Usitatibacteraceae bacterium]|nr:YhdP family protein [Usitatibacteraceae bacterium]
MHPRRQPAGSDFSEDSIKAISRSVMRAAAALAGAALVAFLATVLALRYVVFPQIDSYRDDIAQSISRASGMAVSIVDVDAGWHGLRPILTLTGVRVADRHGKAFFELERAEITLSWWTLLAGDLRFNDIDLYSPQLRLRRGMDGLIYLADKPLNAPVSGEDGALAAWLLDQPRLAIHDATLVWQDEFAGAPELELRQVEIAVRKAGRRHQAALYATPPAAIAARLDLRADLLLARKGEGWQASGSLYGETGRADLERLRAHVPIPDALRTAVGGVRAWVDFEPGQVRDVTADLNLRDVRAQLAADALPLDLETLSGRAYFRLQEGGYAAGTRDLAFRTREGLSAREGDFSLSIGRTARGPARGEVRANGVDLKIAAALLAYLPVPRETKAQANRYAPRGRLLDTSLVWTGESLAEASAFRLKSRFEDVGVNPVEGFPGASGLTGTLEGDERGGKLRLASRHATFEAASIFRAPLAFDTLDARATWTRDAKGLEVRIDEAHLANADAEMTVAGTYRTLPGSAEKSPGEVDLAGRVERAHARAVANYLPNGIAVTRDWLDRAILAGELSRGRFELKGDLWHFPYRDAKRGHFLVEAALDEGRLQYHPAWPSVDRVRGTIRFENARMEITAQDAGIYASKARSVRAVIADLGAGPPVLELDGDIETTGLDSVRFLRETPLVEGPGAFTNAVSIDGPARLKLKLTWPLWGEDPFHLNGEYAFSGATASVGRSLVLTGVRGPLAFTEKSVLAPELTGTMFGQPARLRLATQPDGSVLTQLDGRMGAAALGAFIPEGFARRMAGATEWKARVVSGALGTELRIESTLKGFAIGLPEPFAKRADESRALAVTIRRLGAADEETVAMLDGGVHARIGRKESGGAVLWNAALKFGAPVTTEPVREGLWLYGNVAHFDLDAWRDALASREGTVAGEAQSALELRGLDVRFARLRYTGRDFERMTAQLQREAGQWRGTLSSPAVEGEVTFDPRGKGRIAARLKHFGLEAETSGAAGPEPAPPAEQDELPVLDIVAERFEFHGIWLGRLELHAKPDGRDWRIDRLDITNDHARLASSGVWRRTATGSLTQLDLNLETSNLHALLEQFGYGEFVTRGEAKLEGQLVWPGYPYEFAPGVLSGRFNVQASKGQFAKVETGAGKLLGLISLQSIPRRMSFDFRDIFSEGFAFDRISGETKLARGVLLTKDFEVVGPSAFVSMAGEVSLPMETQNLSLKVVPEVGEGIALAATVLGTPVMGLTTLLLQKLLRNPFGKVVSYEYLVTGSWDNPSVTRIGAAPPPRETPKAAPPLPRQP